MNPKRVLFLLIIFLLMVSAKDERPAYLVYTAKGKQADWADLLKAAKASDIVLFGEMHDNPVCHWLELQLEKELFEYKGNDLVLGAEMLERDNQLLLNEYISGMIRKKDFESEAKLWPNYKTDYAPLVDFAKEHNLKFIATDVPRRYAAIVNREGFAGLDSINGLERALMAPIPIKFNPELKCYKDLIEGMEGMGPGHQGVNIAYAQALKDATMAHFLMKNLGEGQIFLHFNGSYHSDRHEGIAWYVDMINRKTANTIHVLVISSVEQDTISSLKAENLGLGDFILCVPSDMTKTQPPSEMPMMAAPAMPGKPGAAPGMVKPVPPVVVDTSATEGGDEDDDD
ncbi:MAG TPA: ChaN family lipoprotein [Bacteroidales bacterium]|nr:ChaN family lipoprotein [Bacteroidales bacterium]